MNRYYKRYEIKCLKTGKTYMGTTKQGVDKWLQNLKACNNQYKLGNLKYRKAFDIIEEDRFSVTLLGEWFSRDEYMNWKHSKKN